LVKSCQRLYDRDNRVFAVKRNLTQKNADKKEELEAYLDHISFINMDLSDISVKKPWTELWQRPRISEFLLIMPE